jgi:Ankyrin repeats (3 copies)
MRRLLKGSCLVALVIWLGLMGGYAYVAWQKTGEPLPAVAIGILGGTFSAIFISAFIGLFTGGRDRAAIRRAVNMEPMKDGRLEAAAGPIRVLDKALEAPFTGRPCVVYEYDVKRAGQGQSDYAGFAMAPCAVETLRGPVKVLGFTMLDQFPAAPDDQIDRARGERYLSSAAFESLGVLSILSVVGELIADDDGSIRKDYKIAGDGVNVQGRRITEKALPSGTPVTLLGQWSESRGGFVAGGSGLTRLFAGDLTVTRKQVGGDAVQTFIIATVFFLILHSMLGAMYFLAPAGTSARGSSASVWDERDCDQQKARLDHGADPNERGEDARTPLMNAARLSDPACVGNLIAAGARIEDRDKFSDTALAHAVVANRDDNVKVLLAAGAKDFRVTSGNGRRITEDDGPVAAVREYLTAVHAGDFEAMSRLLAHSSVARLEGQKENLPGWQSIRPKTVALEGGWMNDDAATFTVRGRTASADQVVHYHVERKPEGWQIQKEWFP